MIPELDGIYLASNPEAFSLGGQINVKTDFLAKARKMASPEIAELIVRFNGTYGGVTGGALGLDMYKLVKKLIVADDEEMVNVSGASIRVLEQMDFGDKQIDPADIASGSTSSTYIGEIRFTFAPPRMYRAKDFHYPVANLLDGGTLQLQFADALPTGVATSSSLSCRVWARVVDGRVKELKSRRKVTEQSFNRDDDFYPIDGAIRALVLTSVLTTTSYTSLTAITALNSTNLEFFPDFPVSLSKDRYRRNADAINTSTDVFHNNLAIALVTPDRGQKIGAMPIVKAAHLRLGATPTAAIVLRDVLVARPPSITALHAGYPDIGSYGKALVSGGVARTKNAGGTPIVQLDPELARILPARIRDHR